MSGTRMMATVTGRVQAVGFRYWVRSQADPLGLDGTAMNEPDGSVTVIAEGEQDSVAKLLEALRSGQTPGQVSNVEAHYSDPKGEFSGFREG